METLRARLLADRAELVDLLNTTPADRHLDRGFRPVQFALPPLVNASDAPKAIATITAAVASGDLTASEASDMAGLVEKFTRAIEVTELESRIAQLEERTKQ